MGLHRWGLLGCIDGGCIDGGCVDGGCVDCGCVDGGCIGCIGCIDGCVEHLVQSRGSQDCCGGG